MLGGIASNARPLPFLRLSIRGKKWRPFHLPRKPKPPQEKEAVPEVSTAVASTAKDVFEDADPCVVSPFQGMQLMRAFHTSPADLTVTLSTRLDVDLTRQSVRGVVSLPYALPTKLKLLAFCPDDEAKEMIALGADFAGITEVSQKIEKGWLGFDRCIATPAIMRRVLPLAKILGPRGLMPSPRSGTVVENLRTAIKDTKSGSQLEYRAVGEGDCSVVIGVTEFADAQLLENMKAFIGHILRSRPKTADVATMIGDDDKKSGSKLYFKTVSLNAEGGPIIPVDPPTVMPTSVGYFR